MYLYIIYPIDTFTDLLICISVFTFQIGYNGDTGQSNLKSASVSEPGPVEVIDVQVQLRGKLKSILS